MRCEVWWAHPANATPTLVELLDDVERERYAGYRREVDQLRFLTGRSLIRGVAAERLGVAASDIVIDSSCYDCGKPHGKPAVAGLELSISHSGDWVVLAVTEDAPVGVDVEEVRAAEVDDLAGISFSATELTAFRAVSTGARRGAFFTYWARKEAVLKATGRGMSVAMSKLTLSPHDEPPRVVAAATSEVDPARTSMTDLDAGDDYRACVAAFTDAPLDVTNHDATDLIKSLG